MSPEVVVIIPETSFTRAHSILTETSSMDWVPVRVCSHLTVVPQVQAPLQVV